MTGATVLSHAHTHIAQGGLWSDPATWGGHVPNDSAHALVPAGISVVLDRAVCHTLSVAGELRFADSADLRVETIETLPGGLLEIGTPENPIRANIVFRDTGPLDPQSLERGLLCFGRTRVHGHPVTEHLKVAEAPMSGDRMIQLAHSPLHWQTRDRILIVGTRYNGWKRVRNGWEFHPPEDEIRVIETIEGATVCFTEPLTHDHDGARVDHLTSIGLMTRSVRFSSENLEARGHIAVRNADTDIRYAAFEGLGRTDKMRAPGPDNPAGRHPLFVDGTGTADQLRPAVLVGNAVIGSPGWGIVQRSSHAFICNNLVHDCDGACIVSESGDETGMWRANLAVFAKGRDWRGGKNANGIEQGCAGDGFYFQSRHLKMSDNIAASCNHGFDGYHRQVSKIFPVHAFGMPEVFLGNDTVKTSHVPIRGNRDNEAFACRAGFYIAKDAPEQGHDVGSVFWAPRAWHVKVGVHLQYVFAYLFLDADLQGDKAGIELSKDAIRVVFRQPRIEGFAHEIVFDHDTLEAPITANPALHGYIITDPQFSREPVFEGREPFDLILTGVEEGPFGVDIQAMKPVGTTPSDRFTAPLGIKTDSLGEVAIPAATDPFKTGANAIRRLLRTTGYWLDGDGRRVSFLPLYFSDRLTGEVIRTRQPVEIRWRVGGEVFRGDGLPAPVDISAGDIEASGEGLVAIDPLAGATHTMGQPLSYAGHDESTHGLLTFDGQHLLYRPAPGWSGTERFKIWLTDAELNGVERWVTVTIAESVAEEAPVAQQPPAAA
ncbi:MAG: G8 domain-containing protein [Pseudomonadota bacterium]